MAIGVVENGFKTEVLKVKVTKGNELTNLETETFDGADFPPSIYHDQLVAGSFGVKEHGLSRSRDRNISQYVSKQVAVLGARGDYVEFLQVVSQLGTSTDAMMMRLFAVDALEFTGVPVAVQHAIFGKYSPFLTPTQPVSPGMIRGIDRQEIELVNNVVLGGDAAWVNQKIRGTASAKWKGKEDNATVTSVALFTWRATPNADMVFVIPRGAKIWAGNGDTATVTYTAA